jgi:hypothetical protein
VLHHGGAAVEAGVDYGGAAVQVGDDSVAARVMALHSYTLTLNPKLQAGDDGVAAAVMKTTRPLRLNTVSSRMLTIQDAYNLVKSQLSNDIAVNADTRGVEDGVEGGLSPHIVLGERTAVTQQLART